MYRSKMHLAFASALMVAVLAAGAAVASGQDVPRRQRMVGTVVDDAGAPVEGAYVKLKNLQNLSIRSFISRSDGSFHFGNLSTDAAYEVWAEHDNRTSDKKVLDRFHTDAVLQVRLTIPQGRS